MYVCTCLENAGPPHFLQYPDCMCTTTVTVMVRILDLPPAS